ncbi:WhiB family transcriptional regulator [Nonomuraea pusilla]|nr:WhiB family transcriptional regulator [Nonomuraea pusilla]
MIDVAAKSDDDLCRPGVQASPLYSDELLEEVDPLAQGRASRWLRRNRPAGWRVLIQALGLPEGSALTAWPDDMGDLAAVEVCARETREDQKLVDATLETQQAAAEQRAEPPAPRPVLMPKPATLIDLSWHERGICRGEDQLFFAPDGERPAEKERRESLAKQLCSWCPSRNACLDHAMTRPESYGVWGGLTEAERHSERRRLQRRGLLASQTVLKVCRRCSVTKLIAEFGTDKHAKDGLHKYCRRCTNETGRERRIRKTSQAVAS